MLCDGCEQQVYVICHQAPGVKVALVFDCLFCEGFQEVLIVTVFIETGHPGKCHAARRPAGTETCISLNGGY